MNAQNQADVLLVTVTKVEALAVLETFQAETGHAAKMRPLGDKTYHFLGAVNDTTVWFVQSEMGAGGLGAALLTV